MMDSSDESVRGDSDSALTSTLAMKSDNSFYLRWSASESESVDGSELDDEQEVQTQTITIDNEDVPN